MTSLPLTPDEERQLVQQAIAARARAHCIYSGFSVGAAVLTGSGTVLAGCNVENASYGLTMCAERVAMFSAIANGGRSVRALAVVTGSAQPASPCGACRQVAWELSGPEHDVAVLLASTGGVVTARYRLIDLLPHAFDSADLGTS